MFRFIMLTILFINLSYSSNLISKKVLYINSYHVGYNWSDEIENSVQKSLKNSDLNIDLKIFRMDSKRNKGEKYLRNIALEAKKIIDEYKPDIVLTSDDNAVKYIVAPYLNNTKIPVIFCGVNVDAKKYNLSSNNITGMIELALLAKPMKFLVNELKAKKISFLSGDYLSSRIMIDNYEKILNQKIKKSYINTIDEWKKEFLKLQENSDILILENISSISAYKKREAEIIDFVYNNTKKITIGWNHQMKQVSTIVFSISAEEQGKWLAKKALEVLKGKKINMIPIATNKKIDVYINTKLGKKVKFIFPFELIDNARLVD